MSSRFKWNEHRPVSFSYIIVNAPVLFLIINQQIGIQSLCFAKSSLTLKRTHTWRPSLIHSRAHALTRRFLAKTESLVAQLESLSFFTVSSRTH